MTQTNRGGLMLMLFGVWFGSTVSHQGWLIVLSVACMGLGGILLTLPTPEPTQAVAEDAANAEVGEKAGELSGPEGNSRA